jgi:hypothetical protein
LRLFCLAYLAPGGENVLERDAREEPATNKSKPGVGRRHAGRSEGRETNGDMLAEAREARRGLFRKG